MLLVFEHVGTLVVRIYALSGNVFAQLVPMLIKLTNVDPAPLTHFGPRVAGVTDVGPFSVRQAHAVSIGVQTWSRPGR